MLKPGHQSLFKSDVVLVVQWTCPLQALNHQDLYQRAASAGRALPGPPRQAGRTTASCGFAASMPTRFFRLGGRAKAGIPARTRLAPTLRRADLLVFAAMRALPGAAVPQQQEYDCIPSAQMYSRSHVLTIGVVSWWCAYAGAITKRWYRLANIEKNASAASRLQLRSTAVAVIPAYQPELAH